MTNEEEKPKTHQEDPILTITEAAKMLGKHRNTLSRWMDDGIVRPFIHPSGVRGIRASQLKTILANWPI